MSTADAEDSPTAVTGAREHTDVSSRGLPPVPALTILWHPELDRVGEVAPLTGLRETASADLGRYEPTFFVPGSNVGRAIDHETMNHSAVRIALTRGGLELRPGATKKKIELNGGAFEGARELSQADLRQGVIVTIGSGFAFCLHTVQYPMIRSQHLGLLGASDAIEEVRRAIARVPNDETLVLLRGETGTGKGLAAKALHDASDRSKGPFEPVNMGAINSTLADSALFGHERGAFTGATAAQPGHFRAAHGGTLFLDEVGFIPHEVQPKLLRVIADHMVQSLGSTRARKVDVRIIAATDLVLEKAVNDGRFISSLYGRLTNGVTINLPPLRERREDIGLLLVKLLSERFGSAAEVQRIHSSSEYGQPWLSSTTIASIALSALPGNVRDLEGLAKNLRTCIVPGSRDTHTVVRERLAVLAELARPLTSAAPPMGKKAPRDLLAALEAAGWKRRQAMKVLNISKQTLWRALQKRPELARLLDLSPRDLARGLEACAGDVARLAREVDVPEALLARRLIGLGRR
jgi:two-component system nitrogen regulation response regulator GlnG